MATAFGYTPCKDKLHEKCYNYPLRCDSCTRHHRYTVLQVGLCKDYFIDKNKKEKKK